jgi:mono/diheme cytochrome c family protein
MKRNSSLGFSGIAAFLIFWAGPVLGAANTDQSSAERDFTLKVLPLLKAKCFACHGDDPKKIKGDLNMLTREALLRGGDNLTNVLVPGNSKASAMFVAITWEDKELEMPPKENDRLTKEQVELVRTWIDAGAPWPGEVEQKRLRAAEWSVASNEDGVLVKTSGGLSPEWTNPKYQPEGLWAYQPVRKPEIPRTGAGRSPAANPIDAFLSAKWPAGLTPAPPADRKTLIRRATFDLTGLPPTPEEIVTFTRDPSPDGQAFGKVVERLLASPHYGERMAQHWLDVTRYADSSGFANDYQRGNAWRYRDYVVRSFNSDKPYPQFVREQIAGDEIDPTNPALLVATGFLRMGPWELTGMEVPKIARQRFLDDVVNSVGETFLAHSLQCARCHDHKFDPVPTRDYYSIQAVFATTQLAERAAPFLPVENIAGFDELRFLEARRREHERTLQEVNSKVTITAARAWLKENGRDAAGFENSVAELTANPEAPGEDRVSVQAVRKLMQQRKVHPDVIPPQHVGFAPEDYGTERVARKGLERLRWELETYEPFALAVYNGRTPQVSTVNSPVRIPDARLTAGELEESSILAGGDPFSQGAKVQPGVLSVLMASANLPSQIPDEIEGRRLAFADWVASADNPLITRAIANRIWLWHFNQPIAGNPNNFGSTGKKPTHPELLDWLAATLVERGWSFKAMHRVIMASEAYRRGAVLRGSVISSKPSATRATGRTSAALPDTELLISEYLLFKPRRLSAEELRDAMLAATGELNPTLGGIPNRPEINL